MDDGVLLEDFFPEDGVGLGVYGPGMKLVPGLQMKAMSSVDGLHELPRVGTLGVGMLPELAWDWVLRCHDCDLILVSRFAVLSRGVLQRGQRRGHEGLHADS